MIRDIGGTFSTLRGRAGRAGRADARGRRGSNFAMSKPAFAPERREIWYTDGSSGFYVLRLPPALWPDPS